MRKAFKNFLEKNIRIILYGAVFIIAVVLITSSFLTDEKWNGITSGVGTGLLTSLVVSIAINHENDSRERRKLEKDKRIVLKDFVNSLTEVYKEVVYRINEYIMLSEDISGSLYSLYDNFEGYNEFEKSLKQINFKNISEKERKDLETLLNFNEYKYKLNQLTTELRKLSKNDYYINGLLSEKEYSGLTSNFANEAYLDYASHKEEFWDDGIIDFEKCIKFLRMTTYICCKGISTLDYCKEKVQVTENHIKNNLSDRYYNEVYLQSEEYIQDQIERHESEQQYYNDHPEELEEKLRQNDEWENKTSEDKNLEDLYFAICGFSSHTIEAVAAKLDKSSHKVLQFLVQEDIQAELKKNRKKRKIIKKIFGDDYLQISKDYNP